MLKNPDVRSSYSSRWQTSDCSLAGSSVPIDFRENASAPTPLLLGADGSPPGGRRPNPNAASVSSSPLHSGGFRAREAIHALERPGQLHVPVNSDAVFRTLPVKKYVLTALDFAGSETLVYAIPERNELPTTVSPFHTITHHRDSPREDRLRANIIPLSFLRTALLT